LTCARVGLDPLRRSVNRKPPGTPDLGLALRHPSSPFLPKLRTIACSSASPPQTKQEAQWLPEVMKLASHQTASRQRRSAGILPAVPQACSLRSRVSRSLSRHKLPLAQGAGAEYAIKQRFAFAPHLLSGKPSACQGPSSAANKSQHQMSGDNIDWRGGEQRVLLVPGLYQSLG
jgi:hypothetical protein